MRNIQLNGCKNITAIYAAASEVSGEASVFYGPVSNLGHSTTVTVLAEKEGLNLEGKVRADTLSALVGVENLRNARFIKIDVDRIFSAFISQGYGAYAIENNYDPQFLLNPPSSVNLVAISAVPRGGLCDVLMTRLPKH